MPPGSRSDPHQQMAPSAWVDRFAPLIRAGGTVLDLAAGAGRHCRLLLDRGFRVVAVDRDVAALAALDAGDALEIVEADLEDGSPWPLADRTFDGIVVANYLHRPLMGDLRRALAPDGVLIYETFAAGNERHGKPDNPDFLLRPGELLAAFGGDLIVVAFEQGTVNSPKPAVRQRLAALRGRDVWDLPGPAS